MAAILPLLASCQTIEPPSTPFATFTPLSGFQLLGVQTPTAIASPVSTSTPDAAALEGASATSTLTETALPSPSPTPSPTPLESITMIFTGQIVPARCVQAETDLRGEADFLYENVREVLADADLTVGTLNAAITDTPPMTGCVETFVLVGSPVQADAMAHAGFDLMSISTNHIKNCGLTSCGDKAFFDTLHRRRAR